MKYLQSALMEPIHLVQPYGWVGHIPFAAWIVNVMKPRTLVELGTHTGNSYLAFCQIVKSEKLDTQCYAVDTWAGDEHAGFYGDEIFHQVKVAHDPYYAHFSNLLRMTFDDAVDRFADGSVDLLHIDGLHTYDAVKHDFETWLPKLSNQAVVLFHDTDVFRDDFGVHEFWREISQQYPGFRFKHCNGLGVLLVGLERNEDLVRLANEGMNSDWSEAQQLFRSLGERFERRMEKDHLSHICWQEKCDLNAEIGDIKGELEELKIELQVCNEQLKESKGQTDECKKQLKHSEEAHSKNINTQELLYSQVQSDLYGQIQRLSYRYNKYKKLWSVKLVKPLIKIEQGLSSANVYRKGFSNLVKEKGSIGKAYQYLRKLNNEQKSIHYSKLCLREYAYKKGGLTQNLSSTPISQSKQSFNLFSEMLVQTVVSNEYVPLRKGNDFCVKDIKLIAFYLPQFHPIDENDHAWGKGFTEWTNVTKAIPQYEGHHQPKLPAELGFYDLRLIDIQKRQIELAKKYGIYGFCYHHYWFDGKRVMNRPIEQILANPQLDFPFCINWANENWTKRWDGLDSEVILAQNHSVKDDLAFIEDAARYMRDHRYIKIDGKPLLMLYRPQLLPNPKETAMRWRQWCKENGLGEIFLVVSHSFEHIDPRAIGFDAAVEFAPNTFKVENITDKMRDKIINPNYSGMLFDYQSAINYSNSYKKPEYLKFRSVCPRWDNEARKPGRGITFVGSSPSKYMAWLKDVIKFTQKNHQASQQLIFINAWNEWAEGAYLEPDRRYGYAYLEATKKALLTTDNTNEKRVAVVVHAFYLDVFEEILSELKLISTPFKLFVSTTMENRVAIDNQLKTSGLEFDIFIFPNKGRDVLPFIKIMPKVVDEGFEFVLKLHTKKSKHRKDGDTWRYDLYNKLIGLERMEKALSIFDEDFNVGIIGPEGHVVQMSKFWGSNQENVLKLSKRLAVHDDNVMSLGFVAGTMFYARVEALLPVMSLGLSDNDFDDEKGQIDGTMAHGLERLFAISAYSLEFKTISFDGSAYVSRYGFADSK